ncbi:MAG: PIG-L family deacetylase [Spirochaetia bacterium]
MMSGTMLLLGEAGCDLRYMNVASGSCGTTTLAVDEIVPLRAAESRAAAEVLGADLYPCLVDDMEVLYTVDLLRRVTAVVRRVQPGIILTQSPQDYMEDHTNTSRLAVSAAFARGMTNFASIPEVPAILNEVAIYHALPYGLCDQVRNPHNASYIC